MDPKKGLFFVVPPGCLRSMLRMRTNKQPGYEATRVFRFFFPRALFDLRPQIIFPRNPTLLNYGALHLEISIFFPPHTRPSFPQSSG
jgi:hypothetical protein